MSSSSELATYKQNRINEQNIIFNRKVSQLYSTLLIQIQRINSSISNSRTKQIRIAALRAQYNTTVRNLRTSLNRTIASIRLFVPKTITFNNTTLKRALLIGINYTGTNKELQGCINDALDIQSRLLTKGFASNRIKLMTDLTEVKPTRANILNEFKNFLINSAAGDLLFFSYSGHGSNTIDLNSDEIDGRDETIIPLDFSETVKDIIDDELKSLIQTYLKTNVTLIALFDSCFSGTVLDLKYQYLDSTNYNNYTENTKSLDTKGNVIMISGSMDNQTSADAVFNNRPNGAMTRALLETLSTNTNITWRNLVKNMRNFLTDSQFTQIPQISCGTFLDIDKNIFI
jgi:hypothetical protein